MCGDRGYQVIRTCLSRRKGWGSSGNIKYIKWSSNIQKQIYYSLLICIQVVVSIGFNLKLFVCQKKSITPNNSYINYRIIFKYLISNNLTLIGTPVDL